MADHGHIRRFTGLAVVIANAEIPLDHVLIYHDSPDFAHNGAEMGGTEGKDGVGTAAPLTFWRG
jgi:hypothetical protein